MSVSRIKGLSPWFRSMSTPWKKTRKKRAFNFLLFSSGSVVLLVLPQSFTPRCYHFLVALLWPFAFIPALLPHPLLLLWYPVPTVPS